MMEVIMGTAPATMRRGLASADDIRRILGELDAETILQVMALQPTIHDLEDAFVFLTGDADIFGPGNPLPSPAGEIVAILTADEQEGG
jgi:hypothetical protein